MGVEQRGRVAREEGVAPRETRKGEHSVVMGCREDAECSASGSARRPGERAFREQVNVKVGNRFTAVRAVVHDEAEAVFEIQLPGQSASGAEEVAEQGLVGGSGFADARDEFFRDDQQVNRGLRMEVVEDDAEVVLVLDLGGDFAVDVALENGFGHGRNRTGRERWMECSTKHTKFTEEEGRFPVP